MLGRAVIDVDVGGVHSSFGELTDATVEHKPYRHGFFVVVLTKAKDHSCYLRGQYKAPINDTRPQNVRLFREKEFHVKLSIIDDGEAVIDGTLITIFVYVATLTIALFLSLVCKVPISGTVTIDMDNAWTRPRSTLLEIKKISVQTKRQTTEGGSINHGLDDVGTGGKAVPGGVIVKEVEMVDGAMADNKTTGICSAKDPINSFDFI